MNLFMYITPFGTEDIEVTLQITKAIYQRLPGRPQQREQFGQGPLAHYIYLNDDVTSIFPIKSLIDLRGRKIGAAEAVANFLS